MQPCYVCDSPGITREHVPPRAIFPEQKDSPGQCHRINLITVPSCVTHNSGKSDDDQFLLVSLAGMIGNNSIGYRQHVTKVDRAIRRSSSRLLEKVFIANTRRTRVDFSNNKFLDVIVGTPDVDRLTKCFDRIVRGLYYHHFGTKLVGETKSVLGFVHHQNVSAGNFQKFIMRRAEMELESRPKHGSNPEAFFYQITEPDQFGVFLFHLCFYGAVNIYVSVLLDGIPRPYHLAMDLMNRGVRTVFTLGDESYEINGETQINTHVKTLTKS
jgi:hypothetical protein